MHLTTDQLRRWHANGDAEDREALVTHVADCPRCAAALADIARTSELQTTPLTFNPKDFLERGRSFAPTAPTTDVASADAAVVPAGGRTRLYWSLAAAAVVVFGVGTALWTRPDPAPLASITRGEDAAVTLVTPEDDANTALPRNQLVFEWTSPTSDLRANLVVTTLMTPDQPAINRPNVRSGYRPSEEELAALESGVTYRWFVEYRSDAGVRVTPARRFRVE